MPENDEEILKYSARDFEIACGQGQHPKAKGASAQAKL